MSFDHGAQKGWILKRTIEMAHEHGDFIKASDGTVYTPEEFCDAIRNKIVRPDDYSVVRPAVLIEQGRKKLYEMMDRQLRFERKVSSYRAARSKSGPVRPGRS